jgi:hypothetical protein
MESSLFLLDLLTGHEPRDWSAGLRPGSILRPDTNAPDRRPALRGIHGEEPPVGQGAFWALITSFYDIVKQIVNNF